MKKWRRVIRYFMVVFAIFLFCHMVLIQEKKSIAEEKIRSETSFIEEKYNDSGKGDYSIPTSGEGKNTHPYYEKYALMVPFVTIGPDWREHDIDIEKLYRDKKNSFTDWKDQNDHQGEYDNIAFANVDDYVNVRNFPSTEGKVIGRIYDGSVAVILETAGENQDWYKIVSGNVNGYIKAEFFLRGNEAAEVMDRYIVHYAKVKADYLNVRKEPTIESARIGLVAEGEKLKLLEDIGDWVQIQYSEDEKGFVSSSYVILTEEFLYGQTLEEIEERERRRREELLKREELEKSVDESISEEMLLEAQQMQENQTIVQKGASTAEGIRNEIVAYAMQYQGNKYVPAGQSLAGGTDCSGFTCFVYADFGYSISRTPQGQYTSAGRSIAYEEIRPGDIICYSSNGGKSCTHVGIYIGDGQIIHSANSRKGVIVQNADYDRIIGVRNVLD